MLPIHIISLNNSTARRDLCAGMMGAAGLPFTFFDAINGATINARTRKRYYDETANMERFKRPLSTSEIGCYLSHLALWKQIAKSKTGAAVILEDDAQIDAGLKTFLKQIKNYDLEDMYLKLDGVPETLDLGNATTTKMTLGRRKVIHAPQIAPRTTGYIIGARAARKMIAGRKSFFRPVDIDIKHYWEHGVPVWTVMPQLVCETRYQYNYLKERKQHPLAASRLILGEN